MREDVELARGLGCTSSGCRFRGRGSSREPGVWSDEAFAHYRDVLQAIRDAGMSAVVTLVHNTWPLHVQAAGSGAGPLDPGFPDRVARFATEVAQRLGDLIDDYVTLNEPNQLVYGWIKGFWMRAYAMPPGQPPYESGDAQMDDVLTLIPNLFRAHAKARDAIRRIRPNARVGTNPLVLGLPQWLQRWIDRNATHLQSPEDAKRQAARIAQSAIVRRRPRRLLDRAAHDDARAAASTRSSRSRTIARTSPRCTRARSRFQRTRKSGAGASRWSPIRFRQASSAAGSPPQRFAMSNAMPDAVDALRRGEVDAVFDDDVTLRAVRRRCARPHAASGLRAVLRRRDGARQPHAAQHRRPRHPRAAARASRDPERFQSQDGRAHRARRRSRKPTQSAPCRRWIARSRAFASAASCASAFIRACQGSALNSTAHRYEGLEPEIARRVAQLIFGDPECVEFVPVQGEQRLSATRSSWLHAFFALRKSFAIFTTLLGTNWWNLGMAGKLPEFLCPRECVGTLDYVGLDYYWGVPSFWPRELHRLSAASDFQYANAPVWPDALGMILLEAAREFPGKPIVVIENGCVVPRRRHWPRRLLNGARQPSSQGRRRAAPRSRRTSAGASPRIASGACLSTTAAISGSTTSISTPIPTLKRKPTDSSRTYAQLVAEH